MYIAQALVSIYEFQDDLQLDCKNFWVYSIQVVIMTVSEATSKTSMHLCIYALHLVNSYARQFLQVRSNRQLAHFVGAKRLRGGNTILKQSASRYQ